MKNEIEQQELKRLLNLIALGNDKATRTVYNHYEGYAYDYAKSITKNHEAAEDVVQLVFYEAFKKIETFNFTSKFSTWLHTFIRFRSVDYLRKHGSNQDMVNLDETILELVPSHEVGILSALENKERDQILQTCVELLSSDLHETYILFTLYGLSQKEIAQSLKTNEGTVKSRLFNAKIKLIDCTKNLYQ